MDNKLLSICIPSYNRPNELIRLLDSIDILCKDDIEIIICEDYSPRRNQIRDLVEEYKSKSSLLIHYYENKVNLGYDANLQELISKSSGDFLMFMGDDDKFIKESLSKYILFLKDNLNLGYILRRYVYLVNEKKEEFRYFSENKFFEAGINAYKALFRKSVFISGFCFKRKFVLEYYKTSDFNGTLLYQLFLCGRIVLKEKSAYCDIPLTIMTEDERGIPEFGNSENEKDNYQPGIISIDNSINFMKSYLVITKHLDSVYNLNCTKLFLKDLSKYSYPVLSIQRDSGILNFINYNKRLRKEISINSSFLYYIYFWSLLIFGKKLCDTIIRGLKRLNNTTPQF
jgi:abequosyltransferase